MSTFRATVLALLLVVALAACGSTGATTSSAAPDPSAAGVATTPDATEEPPVEATDVPEEEPTDEAVDEPTDEPEPTAEPTPRPAKVSYAKLSNRAWAKVVKSPDRYLGKTYQLWACIFQFDAATGDDAFLAQASNKKRAYWFTDGENASFTGDADRLADFVEDDVVVMNVTSLGSYSYDTQAGGNTTVPAFHVEKITRKGSCD
jgi:hypothetical protein